MSALAAGLFTAIILGFFWHRDKVRRNRRHNASREAWISLTDEWIGRYKEREAELHDSRAHAAELAADLAWARVIIATQAAPELRPDILAAHRDLAPVVPIGGQG